MDQKRALEDLLGALTPRANRGAAEPSAARLYVREHFETLTGARERGITWQQIVDVLATAGVTADDGTPLKWRTASSLFHAERYTRGERRKRRKKAAQPTATTTPAERSSPTVAQPATDDDALIVEPSSKFHNRPAVSRFKPKGSADGEKT